MSKEKATSRVGGPRREGALGGLVLACNRGEQGGCCCALLGSLDGRPAPVVRSRRPGTQSCPLRRKEVKVRESAAGLMAPVWRTCHYTRVCTHTYMQICIYVCRYATRCTLNLSYVHTCLHVNRSTRAYRHAVHVSVMVHTYTHSCIHTLYRRQERQAGRNDWFYYTSTKCAIPRKDTSKQTQEYTGMILLKLSLCTT
jgi:hypothetical protein